MVTRTYEKQANIIRDDYESQIGKLIHRQIACGEQATQDDVWSIQKFVIYYSTPGCTAVEKPTMDDINIVIDYYSYLKDLKHICGEGWI